MKEENAHNATIKVIEYSSILVFFLVLLFVLVPLIQKIVYNMAWNAAMTSTKETVNTVKTFYTDMNLFNEVGLPFKVVFYEDGHEFYEFGKKVSYLYELNIQNDGELPTGGSVQINKDGSATVTDLTFGHFKCNQTNEQNLECKREE